MHKRRFEVLDSILDDVKPIEVSEGIFSVLSEAERGSKYDKKVGVYDPGCESLVFTVNAYADSTNKSIVLFDRSMGMLEKRRKRLIKKCGSVPKHITFMQGDIFGLPFHRSSFDLVMSHGILHMFDNKNALLTELERVKNETGMLSFTSLVTNNILGEKHLSILKKSGEVAGVHSTESLSKVLEDSSYKYA